MPAKSPPPRAAGAIIAFTTIAGAIIGTAEGQPTIGLLGGLGIGVLAAVLLWLRDRARD